MWFFLSSGDVRNMLPQGGEADQFCEMKFVMLYEILNNKMVNDLISFKFFNYLLHT